MKEALKQFIVYIIVGLMFLIILATIMSFIGGFIYALSGV